MRGFLAKKISTRFGDLETKLERICVLTGKAEKLDYVLKKRSNLDDILFGDWTALHAACYNMHEEVVKYLVDKRLVDLYIRDEMGCTALDLAAWRGNLNIVKYLCEHCNVERTVDATEEYNPMQMAIFGGHMRVVQYLSQFNSGFLQDRTQGGVSTFMLACQVGRLNVVQFLFSTGKISINDVDNRGWTALHYSCAEGHPRVTQYLLSVGANIHAQDNSGSRPLDNCCSAAVTELMASAIDGASASGLASTPIPDTAPATSCDYPITQTKEEYMNGIESFREFVAHFGAGPMHGVGSRDDGSLTLSLSVPASGGVGTSSFISQLTGEFDGESILVGDVPAKVERQPARRLSAKGHVVRDDSLVHDEQPQPDDRRSFLSKESISAVLEKATNDFAANRTLSNMSSDSGAAVRLASELLATPPRREQMQAIAEGTPGSQRGNDTRETCFEKGSAGTLTPEVDGTDVSANQAGIVSPTATSVTPVRTPTLTLPRQSQQELVKQLSNPKPSDGVIALVFRICKRLGDVLALINLVLKHPEALHADLKDDNSLTPLHCAVQAGFSEVVEFLVEKKVYIHTADSVGNTPLHIACALGKLDIARLIVDKDKATDIDINATNENGETPLHLAILGNHIPVVLYLVRTERANLSIKDNNGKLPIDNAVDTESQEIVDILEIDQTAVDSDVLLSPDITRAGAGHAISALRAVRRSPKPSRKSSLEDNSFSMDGSASPLVVDVASPIATETPENSPVEEWTAKIELNRKATSGGLNSPGSPSGYSASKSSHNSDIDAASNKSPGSMPKTPGTPVLNSSSLLTESLQSTDGVINDVEYCAVGGVPIELTDELSLAELTSTPTHRYVRGTRSGEVTSLTKLFGRVESMVSEMEDEMQLLENAEPEHTNLMQDILNRHYSLEEDYDRDEDEIANHTDKLASLLGYSPGGGMDSLLATAIDTHRIISGATPPPECMGSDEKMEWAYLNQALIQAVDMECETKEYSERTMLTVLDTSAVMRVDIRWLYLMGAVCRVMGSHGYRAMARSFYHWKYVDIGGPAAVGLYTSLYHRPLTKNESPSQKQSNVTLTARMSPALLFALRVLSRYVRRCRRENRLVALARAWSVFAADISRKGENDADGIVFAASPDDFADGDDTSQRMQDTSLGFSVGSVFPELNISEVDNRELGGSGDGSSSDRVVVNEVRMHSESLYQVAFLDDVEGDAEKAVSAPGGDSELRQGHSTQAESESSESDGSESDDDMEEPDDLTLLGPMPLELNALFRPNEHVLWDMFVYYVQDKLLIPPKKMTDKKRVSKRIMSIQGMWNLLHDFGVCPTICRSMSALRLIIESMMEPGQVPSVYFTPSRSSGKPKSSDPVLSFNGYLKLLWAIARDCLESPPAQDPTSRLLSIFYRLDGSTGRKKMASHYRDSKMLAPFNLSDPAVQRQISEAEATRLQRLAEKAEEKAARHAERKQARAERKLARHIARNKRRSPSSRESIVKVSTVGTATAVTTPCTTTTTPSSRKVSPQVASPTKVRTRTPPSAVFSTRPYGGLGATAPATPSGVSMTGGGGSLRRRVAERQLPRRENREVTPHRDSSPRRDTTPRRDCEVSPRRETTNESISLPPSSAGIADGLFSNGKVASSGGLLLGTTRTIDLGDNSDKVVVLGDNLGNSSDMNRQDMSPIQGQSSHTDSFSHDALVSDSVIGPSLPSPLGRIKPTIPKLPLHVITESDRAPGVVPTKHLSQDNRTAKDPPPLVPKLSLVIDTTSPTTSSPSPVDDDAEYYWDPLPAPRKSDSPVPTELEQQQEALQSLAKKPVNDRTNAKLAAKQFEALVSKMKSSPVVAPVGRHVSPGHRYSSPSPGERPPSVPSAKRSSLPSGSESATSIGDSPASLSSKGTRKTPLPRPTREKNYTENVWLSADIGIPSSSSSPAPSGGQMGSPLRRDRSGSSGHRKTPSWTSEEYSLSAEEIELQEAKKQSALSLWSSGNTQTQAVETATAAGAGVCEEDVGGLEEGAVEAAEWEAEGADELGVISPVMSPVVKTTRKRRGSLTRRR